MQGLVRFLKTTLIGGVVFLVPVIIVVAIVGKALQIMKKMAEPLSDLIPTDMAGDIIIVDIIAIMLIVLVCLLAGLAARSGTAAKLVHKLESNFLSHIPVYAFVKGMTTSLAGAEEGEEMKAVLARFDDYSQVVFEIERLEGGRVVVYLPGAPNPWSGSVCIVTEDRIQPIDATMILAVKTIKHLGRGSGELISVGQAEGRPNLL